MMTASIVEAGINAWRPCVRSNVSLAVGGTAAHQDIDGSSIQRFPIKLVAYLNLREENSGTS